MNNLQETLMLILLLPSAISAIWAIKNRNTLKDKFNLIFRRKKVVKINFRTATGFIVERYIIPNERGIANIENGSYFINRDLCDFNARYRIPEITFIETQPSVAVSDLLMQTVKTKVKKITAAGEIVEVDEEVPNYVLSTRRLTPKRVSDLTAQEIRSALDSKIIQDIVTATNPQMQKIELMFYVMIGTGVVCLIGFYLIHNEIAQLKNSIDTLARIGLSQRGGV